MSTRKDAIRKAALKAHDAYDPAIERHKDKLFGTPVAKDDTPVAERSAGPGRVLVEWIGDSGPLADAQLNAAVQLKLLPATLVEVWRAAHEFVTTRIPGVTHHTMSVERDGMSENYTWGPYEFVLSVAIPDADKLLAGTFGHQFRIIGYDGEQPADRTLIDRYLTPFVDADTDAKVRRIVIKEGTPERLSGVVAQGVGTWTPRR